MIGDYKRIGFYRGFYNGFIGDNHQESWLNNYYMGIIMVNRGESLEITLALKN